MGNVGAQVKTEMEYNDYHVSLFSFGHRQDVRHINFPFGSRELRYHNDHPSKPLCSGLMKATSVTKFCTLTSRCVELVVSNNTKIH